MSNSQSTLKCRVRKSGDGYEGTVFVNGLKPTKLMKKDETSIYSNVSGVTSAAKALATRLGWNLEVEEVGSKAATKSATSTKAKPKKTSTKTPTPTTSSPPFNMI